MLFHSDSSLYQVDIKPARKNLCFLYTYTLKIVCVFQYKFNNKFKSGVGRCSGLDLGVEEEGHGEVIADVAPLASESTFFYLFF